MNSLGPNWFDIFEIYRRFCELRIGNAYVCGEEGYQQDEESQRAKFSRDALNQLLKMMDSRLHTRNAIFDEVLKLMLQLDLVVDFSEFSRFYDFVFFICREDGQKNITVSRAVAAWRLVLAGRFRLLNQWCEFVEKNQRHNISEDTWQQVLAFSRCVHENLEGYDPEGAWPVIIDDFVEHMYRISGSNKVSNVFCSCGDSESQSRAYEDSLPGLREFPGLKRKLTECGDEKMESNSLFSNSPRVNCTLSSKRSRLIEHRSVNREDNPPQNSSDECMEVVKHGSPMGSSKSPCAVEGCLSKGFAGLSSSCSFFAV
ncbi:uncharacterized protein LOC111299626 [Durio zibethinus]|uniref:Defective in cullin neddylation protein n=1 Tax=Durio zibethinus TaxID=66656 RepID=A0A6P5ZE92_DURZI|nr:uncharacterized protein LOC111299626 [Durio zibethinus]XP_022750662.1 uncharacterized protein LOC111299626 [Durio zibethinus]